MARLLSSLPVTVNKQSKKQDLCRRNRRDSPYAKSGREIKPTTILIKTKTDENIKPVVVKTATLDQKNEARITQEVSTYPEGSEGPSK